MTIFKKRLVIFCIMSLACVYYFYPKKNIPITPAKNTVSSSQAPLVKAPTQTTFKESALKTPSASQASTSNLHTPLTEIYPTPKTLEEKQAILNHVTYPLEKNTPTPDTTNAATLPLSFQKAGISGSLGAYNTQLSLTREKLAARASFGLGYAQRQNDDNYSGNNLGGNFAFGFNPSSHTAIGLAFLQSGDVKDASLGGVFSLPSIGTTIKLAASYLWGNEDFAFKSSTDNEEIYQTGYYISTEHNIPASTSKWLHSVGASAWVAQAFRPDQGTTSYNYYTETQGSSVNLYNDPKNIALGQLLGASYDMQFAPRDNLLFKTSLGYEQLYFPYTDGSSSTDRSLYHAIQLQFEPLDNLVIGTEYKKGSSEERVGLSFMYKNLSLSLYENIGLAGIESTKGCTLTYTLFSETPAHTLPLAERLRSNSSQTPSSLLERALQRPTQLPLSLMAKVDTTANTPYAVIATQNTSTSCPVQQSYQNGNILVIGTPYTNIQSIQVHSSGPLGNSVLNNVASSSGSSIMINIPLLQQSISIAGNYTFTITFQENNTPHTIVLSATAQAS